MQNQQDVPLSQWLANCHCLQLIKASRHALNPGKLGLAFVGLVVTFLCGSILDLIWVGVGSGIPVAEVQSTPLICETKHAENEQIGVFRALALHEKYCLDHMLKSTRKLDFFSGMGGMRPLLMNRDGANVIPRAGEGHGTFAFVIAMLTGLEWLVREHWFFASLLAVVFLAVWSFCGGAICRISALQFARGERITSGQAARFGLQKFWHNFFAPVIPLLGILFLGVSLLVFAWLFHITSWFGSVLVGPLFGIAVFVGAMIALICIGLFLGFSLMWPTIGYEGMDCWEAISRSVNYVFERPERSLLYAFIALLYGAFVWLVIRFFAFLLVYAAHGFVSIGYPELNHMWVDPPTFDTLYAEPATTADESLNGVDRNWALPWIKVWAAIGGFLLYGYLVSYYMTASTIIYSLLRFRVDDTELDEVFIETPDEELPPPPIPPTAEETETETESEGTEKTQDESQTTEQSKDEPPAQ